MADNNPAEGLGARALRLQFPTSIAYDPVLCRPGCAIVAATLGANERVCQAFNVDYWLLAPTPNMQKLVIPDAAFLERVVKVTGERAVLA